MEATSKVSGKKKLNAVQLDHKTMICEIRCGYTDKYLATLQEPPKYESKLYKLRSFLSHGKIIEINERVLKNVRLMFEKPESDGYLCIFQLNKDHDTENTLSIEENFINNVNLYGPPLIKKD